MNPFLSASERRTLLKRFQKLTPEMPALFGLMSAQHMVEHVALTFSISNGRMEVDQTTPERLANITKRRLLQTEMEFPKGFKAPILPENETIPLVNENLESALLALESEIDAFERWFVEYPGSQPVHPVMGPLGFEEWQVFHSKHLRHHLEQFGV